MSNNIFLLLLILPLLIACGSPAAAKTKSEFDVPISNRIEIHQDGDHDGHAHSHTNPAEATAELKVVLVPSELVVGPNRFAVGLFDPAGRMIQDGLIQFHYFDLSDPNAPVLESKVKATRLQTPDGLTTIFAHERSFDRPGAWGVEVQALLPNGVAAVKRIGFQVLAGSPTLAPGDLAPALDTPVAVDVKGDLRQLASALEPNPAFYQLSLAEALTNGKPTVLLFATPAFCQTRFCGPAYDIVSNVQKQYGDAVNFVHVEVYTGLPNPAANNWEMAPAMAAFGLSTEPWLFLMDRDGKIIYRVEGLVTATEIEARLKEVIQKTE
jgi:hypothetical protein